MRLKIGQEMTIKMKKISILDMDQEEFVKCKEHPKYKAFRHPKRTTKYPQGCPVCVKLYEEIQNFEDLLRYETEEIWPEVCRIVEKGGD